MLRCQRDVRGAVHGAGGDQPQRHRQGGQAMYSLPETLGAPGCRGVDRARTYDSAVGARSRPGRGKAGGKQIMYRDYLRELSRKPQAVRQSRRS
jgi:hypothetical protein